MRYTLGLGVGSWRRCTGHRAVSAPGATAMVLHLNPRLESGQLDQLDQLDRPQQLTLSPPRSKAGHLQQPAEPGHSDLRISIDLGPCLGTSSPSPPRTATSLLNTRQEQEKEQGRCWVPQWAQAPDDSHQFPNLFCLHHCTLGMLAFITEMDFSIQPLTIF